MNTSDCKYCEPEMGMCGCPCEACLKAILVAIEAAEHMVPDEEDRMSAACSAVATVCAGEWPRMDGEGFGDLGERVCELLASPSSPSRMSAD